jgi:hypothetical protein
VAYTFAMRGDGLTPMWRPSADQQRAALDALMRTLTPSELALPVSLVNMIPPRPPGYGRTRELFPRYTGGGFDAITPAVVAASLTVNALLTPDRAARMVEQKIFDPSLPGLDDVLARLLETAFRTPVNGGYESEVRYAVQGVVIDRIEWLASNASMPTVRAISTASLQRMHLDLVAMTASPHSMLMARNIQRFMDRPAAVIAMPTAPNAPPGSPIGQAPMDWLGNIGIGQPAQDWLSLTEPWCTWDDGHR